MTNENKTGYTCTPEEMVKPVEVEWETLYFCKYDNVDDFKKDFDNVIRNLIEDARTTERKRIAELVDKLPQGEGIPGVLDLLEQLK